MPGVRKMILSHVMSGLCGKMNRVKHLDGDVMETPLRRCLNTFDMTLLGVGHMIGAGIYVLTGAVAKDVAGPGIVISFLIAGFTSFLAALCYAEFGTRCPKAGSAYVYTYISIGEFWAFIIGWNIILEHMIGAASVARAWSGYVDSLLDHAISNTTVLITGEMHEQLLGRYPDLLAFGVCISYALLLGIGVKGSALVNSIFTIVNLLVILLIITTGFYYATPQNWTRNFLPFGWSGVLAGAATCFYAFVGFDSITTSGEEAREPSVSIPFATIFSMGIVTISYILVSAALTLMVPFSQIHPTAALPDAFAAINHHWLKYMVSVGALCGMTTTLFGSLFSLPRCMYAMASDGLLFEFMSKINPKTKLPLYNLAIGGFLSALLALLFDLEKLVEFMSIGTLLAYTIVSSAVIVLRYRPISPPSIPLTPGTEDSSPETESCSPVSDKSNDTASAMILAGHLRTNYSWLTPVFGKCEPGGAVTGAVILFICASSTFCITFHFSKSILHPEAWWTILLNVFLLMIIFLCVFVMVAHQQNTTGLRFQVPMVPYIPCLSIFFNIELMIHLSVLTWIRFIVWMIIGMLVYFLYGIHHSKESDPATTYSMLMTSSEAGKSQWGATTRTAIKGALMARKHKEAADKKPIIDEEEIVQ
ncbi:cationic amino acid transporter 4 [Chrysoperla carnea]|uniref:cationic amino acid transporter 4 n=1 Tax=Chrysoperla carnea TaxID=189513 RepID=UPI001D0951FC|nr:cationic amino acid transporter 4 [Chrysoperla carnea]